MEDKKVWLVTGCAGFIGSNLTEYLINNNQSVIGIDNFSTGTVENLNDIQKSVDKEDWNNFFFLEADIRNIDLVESLLQELVNKESIRINYVIHQAAIGSVPRSIEEPLFSHTNNVDGFINILEIARSFNIKRVVYASSSSVYGDEKTLPKVEKRIGKLLSPYAATKFINEIYADIYSSVYGMEIIGLRYFNVFGKRQDPSGPYAAVIPKWLNALINNEGIIIYGDGETSRDFCYIDNVINANVLAAQSTLEGFDNRIFNIDFGTQTSLNELSSFIIDNLTKLNIRSNFQVEYSDFRPGDIKHSLADISNARNLLSYIPLVGPKDGLLRYIKWYVDEKVL